MERQPAAAAATAEWQRYIYMYFHTKYHKKRWAIKNASVNGRKIAIVIMVIMGYPFSFLRMIVWTRNQLIISLIIIITVIYFSLCNVFVFVRSNVKSYGISGRSSICV